MADDPPVKQPPEDPSDRSIRLIRTRLVLLERAIRGEFSAAGRTFGSEEFDRLWKAAGDKQTDRELLEAIEAGAIEIKRPA